MHRANSLFFLLFVLLFSSTMNAETIQVRNALVQFMEELSPGNNRREGNWGWNASSDPCTDAWKGVTCYANSDTIKRIVLDQENLTGQLDAVSLCSAKALTVLSLNNNNVVGNFPEEISNCGRLTHIYLHGNSFSGNLPTSLSRLSNLKRVVISDNDFSGNIPDMSRISGLLTFLAENNNLTGGIPTFDFSNLEEFNVSNNNLTGPVPDLGGKFNQTSVLGNPGLCGKLLPNTCPSDQDKKKGSSKKAFFIYSGYVAIGVVIISLVAFKLIKKGRSKEKSDVVIAKKSYKKDKKVVISSTSTSSESKGGENRSEFSITSVESGKAGSASLVVLYSPVENVIKFEDLLKSPAELMGRGRHGSLYKVTLGSGLTLAVKRIRDWDITKDDFKIRMERIDEVKHPNVMPIVAFYCSIQEKLLVYEFQQNGSLFSLLHGSQNGQSFDWGSRLSIAAKISEALAFMHEGLQTDDIPHGNLKSSNILLSNQMEPLISEYGLALAEVEHNQGYINLNQVDSFQENNSPGSIGSQADAFKTDTYSFGVILLELLTGKIVMNNGFDLAMWVNSAIREEWTVEVFDKTLVSDGASEESMVSLLQVALSCISLLQEERPSIREVAGMIKSIKEYEDKSITSETSEP